MFASYAKEQQAQLDILRARLADAEAGKVELPEPATLDALYEREVARQRATDEGGASSADEFATAAGEAIRETPDLMIVDDAGNVRPAGEVMAELQAADTAPETGSASCRARVCADV